MKWWKIVLICIAVLLIIGSAWWYFYRETPVEEGFQAASLQVVSNATLHPSSVLGTESSTGSYTIFDPSAAYLQAKIYEIEYGPALAALAQQESNFTNVTLPILQSRYSFGVDFRAGKGWNSADLNDPNHGEQLEIHFVGDPHPEIDKDTYRKI